MKKLTALLAVALIFTFGLAVSTPVVQAQTGCASNLNKQIPADGAAVSDAVLAIAAVETDPTVKQHLITAANALRTATANWKVGTPTDDINTAAVALEAVLGSIPQTSQYVVLVPIAVAAIDILLENLPVSTTSNAKAKTLHVAYNPYRGKATIPHRFGRSRVDDFKAAWNAKAPTPALQLK
jgi:hypothetical protein